MEQWVKKRVWLCISRLWYLDYVQVLILSSLGEWHTLFCGGVEREEREKKGKPYSKNNLQLLLMTCTWLDDCVHKFAWVIQPVSIISFGLLLPFHRNSVVTRQLYHGWLGNDTINALCMLEKHLNFPRRSTMKVISLTCFSSVLV